MSAFTVLAEPRRRQIVDLLGAGARSVGELVAALGISQPGTSKHLRVLLEAGIVDVRQDAQRRIYQLNYEPLLEIDEWLRPHRSMWADALDRLDRHLDSAEGPSSEQGSSSRERAAHR